MSIIKPEYSPLFLLGKLCFRRAAPWEQRSKIIVLLWSVFAGILAAALVMTLIFLEYYHH